MDMIKNADVLLEHKPLRLADAAVFTGLSEKYLYNLVSQRQIPFYKPRGGILYFRQEDLEAFIYRNRSSADYELREKAERILTGGSR